MRKPVAVAIGVVALLIFPAIYLLGGTQQDDQTMIKAALHESIEASRKGKPGGVLSLLSTQFKWNDQETGLSSKQIAEFIRNQRPDITIENERPVVAGDEARITTGVNLSLSLFGQSREFKLKDVVLVFKKEDGVKLVFVPTKKWHLSEVRASINPEDLAQ